MKLRVTVRRLLSFAVLPFVVILYFNIENLAARLGWANILADAVAPQAGGSPVVEFLQHPATLWIALIGIGMAVGMWLDFFLYRRERAPIEAAMERAEIDRLALASDAMRVGRGICALAAQGAARERVAWGVDRDNADPTRGRGPSSSNSAREQSITLEKYAEQFHADAWAIIDKAGRLLNLDGYFMWRAGHSLSIHNLDDMGRFLISVANELDFPGNPVLPDTRQLERQERFNQAQAEKPQSPQGTGSETPL